MVVQALNSPSVVSLLSDLDSPVAVFDKLSKDDRYGFLFESAEGDNRLARYSFIGIDPRLIITLDRGSASVVDTISGTTAERKFEHPLRFLKDLLAEYAPPDHERLPFPFSGGLVGYTGYGATNYLEKIPRQTDDPLKVPDAIYGLYDLVIVFDHQYRRLHIVSHRDKQHARAVADRLRQEGTLHTISAAGNLNLSDDDVFAGVGGPVSASAYRQLVAQAKEFILEGQVFQIVVAHRMSLPSHNTPLNVYRLLQALNPSPYAYMLKFPEFCYIGSSPETFVKCHNNEVTLRAIAGTRPRGKTLEEDARLEVELKTNEKEMAEHLMLVDLGRNDLGRVCQVGSIEVGEIAQLISYSHVMHLATEIKGTLSKDKSCFDAFASCFPRGTVSGAPKVRAMQLLSRLETEQRGIYSGVVGYFDFHGNMDGAIAIRSALLKDGTAHISAGAGIVLDSNPQAEYEETRNKAKSVISAVQLANALVKEKQPCAQ
jgi:anthranilate synthase component 1